MDLFVYVFHMIAMVSVLAGDDNSRKTFLVRYSNGHLTIPVTVVLDYKKQVEYVINMNSRTPTKSVTFYDFKERTIAYKDMTNKECFLGRLTHESLQEENELLSHLENPVNTNPLVLNLAASRSSLTPTEVKNIAGDKIAMFCGKMSTWLLQESNSRNRRQVGGNRRYTGMNPTYQSVPLYKNDVQVHTPNERRRHFQVPDVDRIRYRWDNHSEVQGNDFFHHHLRVDDIANVTNLGPYSHPISSSVPLYKSHQNNDVITFHPRDPKRQNDVYQRFNIHHRNRGPFEYPDSVPPQIAEDTFNPLLNRSWPVQYHPRLLPGSRVPDGLANSISRYPERSLTRNELVPSHFEYSHQLRRGTQTPLDGLSESSVAGNILKDIGGYNSQIQTIHFRSNEANLRRPNTSPPKILHIGNEYSKLHSSNATEEFRLKNLNNEQDNKLLNKDIVIPIGSSFVDENFVDNKNNYGYSAHKVDINETLFKDGAFPQYKSVVNEQYHPPKPYVPFYNLNVSNDASEVARQRDRSDLPSEQLDFARESPLLVNSSLEVKRNANGSSSVTNAEVVEGIPSQERTQNNRQLFRPDDIIIDVDNVSKSFDTQSVGGFINKPVGGVIPKTTKSKFSIVNPVRRRTNSSRSDSRLVLSTQQRPDRPTRRRDPTTTMLPPGVEMHPRHPNAPYAQLPIRQSQKATQLNVQSNTRHHQRHRRKKHRRNQRCCSQGRKSCCENGPARKQSAQTACCHNRQPSIQSMPTISHGDVMNDMGGTTKEELCDIKKMCRTLYQSTKSVKVCKINNVPDC